MVLTDIIKETLQVLTLFGGIAIVSCLILSAYEKFTSRKLSLMNGVRGFVKKHALLLTFLVALTATLGSLFYSEILGYSPCRLCWYQRILMYPLSIILGVALIKRDHTVDKYVKPMVILGGIIALYHYITQLTQKFSVCDIDAAVPCTVKFTFAYGYITIPMMALTGFALIYFGLRTRKYSF